MTSSDERQALSTLIHEAVKQGYRLEPAYNEVDITLHTYRRSRKQESAGPNPIIEHLLQ